MDLNQSQLKDLVTARATLRRAEQGHDGIDFETAASMIDRVLATSCSHEGDDHHTAPDVINGRLLTTCYACGVTWYADFADRLPTAE